MLKKYSSMLVILVLVLLLISLSCGSDSETLDSKISSYLTTMKGYYDEWEELYWYDHCEPGEVDCDDRYDEIINALLDLNPPLTERSPHSNYVNAHRLYVIASRHLYTMEQLEKEHARAQGYGANEIPCQKYLQSGYICSQEYLEACHTERLATENLILERVHWDYEYRQWVGQE